MIIRRADLADLNTIVALDHSYTTEHVWQLVNRETNSEISALLRLAPLPRQLKVPWTHDVETLRRIVNRCDYLWVLHSANDAREVHGYIGMTVSPWQSAGWLPCLAVAPRWRRKGVATKLIHAARAQAKADGLQSVMIDLATKNYPAMKLCLKDGFRFSGYADHYYASKDIALFFSCRV